MKAVSINLIRARRAKLDEEITDQRKIIEDAQARIDALAARKEDLDIAERVITELAADTDNEQTVELGDEAQERTRLKPADIPPMPQMITVAVYQAHKAGQDGIEPYAMTEFIRGRWWPEVIPDRVSTIAWRMMKRNELTKLGKLYALPFDKRPAINRHSPAITAEEINWILGGMPREGFFITPPPGSSIKEDSFDSANESLADVQ